MFGFGEKQRIAELEARVAELTEERDALRQQVEALTSALQTETAAPHVSAISSPSEHTETDFNDDGELPPGDSIATISFNYGNADGEESHRVVDVYRVYQKNGLAYIDGFCRMRGSERTFRIDRIIGEIYEPATAEMYEPIEFASLFCEDIDPDEADEEHEDYNEPEERKYWDVCEYVPVDANLEIVYGDSQRRHGTYHLRVQEYDGTAYLFGFCDEDGDYLRYGMEIERISSCIDMDTGEEIKDIPAYLLQKYRQSPVYSLEQGMTKLADILPVLFYVGKADGRLMAAERAILRGVVRQAATHPGITDLMIDKKIDKQPIPPLSAVKVAVDRIASANPRQMGVVYKIAQRMVNTDKSVKPEETEILEYMASKMPAPGK